MQKSRTGTTKFLAAIVAFTAITPLLSAAPSAIAQEVSSNAVTATIDAIDGSDTQGARLTRQITVKDPTEPHEPHPIPQRSTLPMEIP